MKVIIAGSRAGVSVADVVDAVASSGFDISEVVSGGARGADSKGETWAHNNRVPLKIFLAEWNNFDVEAVVVKENSRGKYNALAGHQRNEKMAEYADALIALWDGKSRGTKDMISRAATKGLPVHIYKIGTP